VSKALEGIRVLDFTHVLSGPYCSMNLGDLGADVIKVEREGAGDILRRWGPPFMPDGESTYFLAVNRNKRSIALDLKSEAGLDLVLQLVRNSDVVLENFRSGVMDSLGLGYERLREINPRLVYGSINAYGTTGPLAQRPGYDVVAQGMSGLMSVTGEPEGTPMRVGVAVVDLVTGLYWTIAILGALQSRNRSGRGQKVDLSLLESSLAIMPNLSAALLMAGVKPERYGNGHPNVVPYNVFPTKDGNMTLAMGNDAQWRKLCAAVGHPEFADDPRYAQNQARVARRAEVDELVAGWLRQKGTDEWVELLSAQEVPCGPIYSLERILADAQVAAVGLIKTVLHPTSGALRMVGAPFHLSEDDTGPFLPPPRLGEHTASVLKDVLSLGDADIAALKQKGAFGGKTQFSP
jgi:crotonobetainyl-CoA:carnitine CoA-transferase CaiB-like acyl-CoA transferase